MTCPPDRALANSRHCFGYKYRNVQPPPKILPTKWCLLNNRSVSNISREQIFSCKTLQWLGAGISLGVRAQLTLEIYSNDTHGFTERRMGHSLLSEIASKIRPPMLTIKWCLR